MLPILAARSSSRIVALLSSSSGVRFLLVIGKPQTVLDYILRLGISFTRIKGETRDAVSEFFASVHLTFHPFNGKKLTQAAREAPYQPQLAI